MNLKTARFLCRLTQIELQNKCGIHQSKLSLLERGLAQPSPEEKTRHEAVLGPSIDWASPQTLNYHPSVDKADFMMLVCATTSLQREELGLHFFASQAKEKWQ